jgi:hypothetical protein
MLCGWIVDETGSESYPVAGFGMTEFEPVNSATSRVITGECTSLR